MPTPNGSPMKEQNRKILIIVYYWPPSGGSGVQRWVKLAKYLTLQGIQVHVLTVDEKYASYMQIDRSLKDEIHPDIKVVKTRSVEIINVFAKLFGKKKVPTAGFYNLDKKSIVHNLGMIIRSGLFIPDPRRGWNYFAYKRARQIIKTEGITKVITSTPPHSSQLIGLKLKKKLKIEWIADLRDPWTDIFYYPLLKHNFLSKRIDKHYELDVLKTADRIFTVSQALKEIFSAKDKRIDPQKIVVLPNGFDEDDFKNSREYIHSKDFKIGYFGTITDQYEPWAFLRAFSNLIKESKGDVLLEITGTVSPNIISYIERLGIKNFVKINPAVPHEEIPQLMTQKSALLLAIPKVDHAEVILTGKLFEYLASRRPVILVGPKKGDAAAILEECHAGSSFDWDSEPETTQHLITLKEQHDKGLLTSLNSGEIKRYSRSSQALSIINLLYN
jgi:glycosyltransferase involved in cell wall biosynthesis